MVVNAVMVLTVDPAELYKTSSGDNAGVLSLVDGLVIVRQGF